MIIINTNINIKMDDSTICYTSGVIRGIKHFDTAISGYNKKSFIIMAKGFWWLGELPSVFKIGDNVDIIYEIIYVHSYEQLWISEIFHKEPNYSSGLIEKCGKSEKSGYIKELNFGSEMMTLVKVGENFCCPDKLS